MSREAMQMALEALDSDNPDIQLRAAIALRQALETEQEPVLWLKTWSDGSVGVLKIKSHLFADHELEPLYAAPQKREWVGLTDEERHGIREWQEIQKELGPVWAPMMLYLYEAIEAKLREKNHG